tara:strand:- start:9482 stop:9985 length:504 start_codon:yes stop_codon:yes gene_type:complete
LEVYLAGKFCPSWLFNLCVARTAYDFITSDLPIRAYATKYASGLSEHFAEIKKEEVEQEAETVLRFLVDINSEESDQLLNNFIYFSLKYVQHGSKRKLKGLFGSALDPTKEKEYQENITLKNFKAYVFGLRSGVSEKPSPGWNIIEEEGIEFLVELIKKEANISDAV